MNFSRHLLSRYHKNKRDLPWRHTKDPYLIWLSEVIMQQTRIEQGTPYYEKFVSAYPTLVHLAVAEEQEVLKLWQGLGYYSRARNLHATAQLIVKEYAGKFPEAYADIRKLKGVGNYTAAAIASVCFGLPYPVMDGNVLRFISRYSGIVESIDKSEVQKRIHAFVSDHIDHKNPGDFNQAMMEFGAMVCMPKNPDCAHCIFRKSCVAFKNNTVDQIPARNEKATIRNRFIHYLVITMTFRGKDFIYLNKRTGNDIWKNLYDFPSIEHNMAQREHHLPENEFNVLLKSNRPEFLEVSDQYIHLLTHQKLHIRFYRFHSDRIIELPFFLIPLKDIHKYPVPKPVDLYIRGNIFSKKLDFAQKK
ncbi:MAG: A/G-specific adenine glycosylase [Bacteroidales bacterium]|nr:A/G-specific adenine glycosylase [Bacteroidales bacterium]